MAKHSLPKHKRRAKDFPLWVHPSGRWCKKIKGRFHYFGKVVDDPDGKLALDEWLRQKDDLLAGRTPRPKGGVEIKDVCNAFLSHKERSVLAGELKPGTFDEYFQICERMIKHFGSRRSVSDLVSNDFGTFRAELAKTYGPIGLVKRIQIVRSVFKYGWEAGIIENPTRFGPDFKRPSAKVLRLARAEAGSRLLTAAEIRKVLKLSSVQVKAMTLLAINAGLGNTDVAELPKNAVDWEAGILSFPRPKTGIPRRAVLWPETLNSLKAAISERPKPKDQEDDRLVFLTKYGHPWMQFKQKEGKAGSWVNSVYLEFNKVLKKIGVDRPGTGFYSLRHTFRTVADELPDRGAIDLVMGHEDTRDMRIHYVQKISDDRLRAVADHVHRWLFSEGK